jgi:hypothetical protein
MMEVDVPPYLVDPTGTTTSMLHILIQRMRCFKETADALSIEWSLRLLHIRNLLLGMILETGECTVAVNQLLA